MQYQRIRELLSGYYAKCQYYIERSGLSDERKRTSDCQLQQYDHAENAEERRNLKLRAGNFGGKEKRRSDGILCSPPERKRCRLADDFHDSKERI